MNHHCITCNISYKSNKCLQQHMKCKKHTDKLNKQTPIIPGRHECNACGKTYYHRQSLHVHKRSCVTVAPVPAPPSVTEIIEELKNTVLEERKINQTERELHQSELDKYQKEQAQIVNELRSQISILLDKHAGTTNHNTTNTNNIETQNINIIIKAFGNENTDYIDNKAILSCISKVYKSIPTLLEKIHFDPNHPENHNIKITNKKLPYASVMGNNQKWKTVDRKDAIETMVLNGYNMLDEKYAENKEKLPSSKQQNFEGFQSKFESEDKDLMKQIKTEVDMMVLNR